MATTARTEGYLEIPGICVPGTDIPDPMPFNHDEWKDWYKRVLVHRVIVKQQTSGESIQAKRARAAQRALCKQPHGIGHLYWLCTFCWIFEPRNETGQVQPFIVWPRQAEMVLEIHATMATPIGAESSMAVEKAREVGATWLDISHHAWCWTFSQFFNGLLISITEDDVDKSDEPSSWMWKLDFVLGRHMRNIGNAYPAWLLPKTFNWKKHRANLKLVNPETQSIIVGSTTTENTARGDRIQKVSIDEASVNPYFGAIWNVLAFTTHHRFCYATAGVNPPDFYHLVTGKEGYIKPRVFRFEWHGHPDRDHAWLESKREEMKEDDFKREVLIIYLAGSGIEVYPEAANCTTGWWPYEPGLGPLYASLDDGYDDDMGIVVFQRESGTQWVRVVAAYQNAGKIMDFYGSILTGNLESRFTRQYGRRDIAFAKWCASINLVNLATFVGDKHGDQNNMVTGTNPFQELHEKYGIYVNTLVTPEDASHDRRKDRTKELIPWLRFHEQNGVPDALEALQSYRYPKRRSSAQPTTENAKPAHTAASHYATAFEYFAVAYPVRGGGRNAKPKQLPKNITGDRPQPARTRFTDRRVVPGTARRIA